MILFRVQLRVSPAMRDRAMKSLLRLVGPTQAVAGCAACGAFVNIEDENTLAYVEEWETQEALDGRLRSDDLRILLSVLDLATEAPAVRFDAVSETKGMEAIATARAGADRKK